MPEEEPNSPPPQLAYERPTGVTRGAFRLLLLLTFINTILLATSLMGPQTWQAVRGTYNAFKERRAAAAAKTAQRAALAAAVTFQFPQDYVAYTESPDEATRMIAQGLPYQPIGREGGRGGGAPPGWQAPVLANPLPALLNHQPLGTAGTVFVHERMSPNGTKMVVLVVVRATYNFDNNTMILKGNTLEETTYRLSRQRRLQAVAFTTLPDGDVKHERQYQLELILPDAQPTEIGVIRQPRNGGLRLSPPPATAPLLRTGNVMRFLGGSPDPADASHFTIPFELDGQAGVIDGWLRDDALLLTPRQGRAMPSTDHPHWDLLPATQPATKP